MRFTMVAAVIFAMKTQFQLTNPNCARTQALSSFSKQNRSLFGRLLRNTSDANQIVSRRGYFLASSAGT